MVAGCWYTLQEEVYQQEATFHHGSRTVPLVHSGQRPNEVLHEALTYALWGKDVVSIDSTKPMPEAQNNQQLLEMFLSAKRVEGCDEKTIHYYQPTLPSYCKPLTSASCKSPRMFCASICRIISRPADVATAISTTSAASLPVFLLAGGQKPYSQKSRLAHLQKPHQQDRQGNLYR